MTWWRRKPKSDRRLDEAYAAKIESQIERDQARKDHQDASRLADRLRQIRSHNHFGEALDNLNWGDHT